MNTQGKVLAKGAEEICLIQCGRLLIRTTRWNSFFLSPFGFGGVFPPGYLAGFPLVSLKQERQQAVYGRQDCRETCCVISVPFSPCLSDGPHSTSAAYLCMSSCVLFYLAMPFIQALQSVTKALRWGIT